MTYRAIARRLRLSVTAVVLIEHAALTKVALALDLAPPPGTSAKDRFVGTASTKRRRCARCGLMGHYAKACRAIPLAKCQSQSAQRIEAARLQVRALSRKLKESRDSETRRLLLSARFSLLRLEMGERRK